LPEPVGAAIKVCSPALIAGQAWAWAAVGSGKWRANQDETAGWNSVRLSDGRDDSAARPALGDAALPTSDDDALNCRTFVSSKIA
jgi:hypothetical protein